MPMVDVLTMCMYRIDECRYSCFNQRQECMQTARVELYNSQQSPHKAM